jgi:hypothetical protein
MAYILLFRHKAREGAKTFTPSNAKDPEKLVVPVLTTAATSRAKL